ncbi:MAG: phosphate ABC transporter permease subunit PstC [Armatimonadota bacterium]
MRKDSPSTELQPGYFAAHCRPRGGLARLWEILIHALIHSSGTLAIIIVVAIFVFLFAEAAPIFREYSLWEMLLGTEWRPTSTPQRFGLLPSLVGSLMVTAMASVVAIPLGLAGAIYIAELASPRAQAVLKPLVELLAAVPSVVFGFIGLTLLSPLVRQVFHLPTGLTGFTASIILAYMAIPTILSLADDAIRAVPRGLRLASYSLGTTRWQTIRYVVLPAARPGVVPAVMLGIGRAIGETMTVLMVAGMAGAVPRTLFQPMRTMTGTIAAEMGEAARGTPHFHALFLVGALLFLITFLINLAADIALHRGQVR